MLKTALRFALLVVLVGVGTVSAASPSAIAQGARKAPPTSLVRDPVLRDCVHHVGEISREFSLAQLRAAQRHMPADIATYTFCPGAVRSAIAALSGPAGKNTTVAIFANCARHNGALTRRYDVAVLRHARRSLPPDLAKYTKCLQGISSQINTLT